MEKAHVTENPKKTAELGRQLASELEGGQVVCLSGELGAGKTVFAQGLLAALGAEGPFTSPTFVVMKKYAIPSGRNPLLRNAYHIDAYRIGKEDALSLGWEELVSDPESVMIVEWAENLGDLIPESAIRIALSCEGENRRRISLEKK